MIHRIHHALDRFLQTIVFSLMIALAVLVVVGVTFRKVGAALVWYDEVAATLLAWLTYYGAALAALQGAHIGFPKLVQSLRPPAQAVLRWVRSAIVITFFVLVVWAGWRVMLVLQGSYLVSLPWVPRALTQSVIPVGGVLFVLAEVLAFQTQRADESS